MIEIYQFKNAKYIDENGRIDCDINHPEHGWIPFTIDLSDTGSDIDVKKLHKSIIDSKDIQVYVPPTDEEINTAKANEVRVTRDALLRNDVDPMVSNPLRWADLSDEKKKAWEKYRQDLLDITKQPKFPKVVTYPKKPD